MAKRSIVVTLSEFEKKELENMAAFSKNKRLAIRAKFILEASKGKSNKDIAITFGKAERDVSKWRKQFAERRLEGLYDSSGRGRKEAALIGSNLRIVLETALEEIAEDGYLPLRTLQQTLKDKHNIDVSLSTLQRSLENNGLLEEQNKRLEEIQDSEFEAKRIEIVGLYISCPYYALFLKHGDIRQEKKPLGITESNNAMQESSFPHRNDPQSLLLALKISKSFDKDFPLNNLERNEEEEFTGFAERLINDYQGSKISMIYLDSRKENDEVAKWIYSHRDQVENLSVASLDIWSSVVEIQLSLLTRMIEQKGLYKIKAGKVSLTSKDIINMIMDYIKEYCEDGNRFGWMLQNIG